jgi:hypothetical protein
LDCPDISDYVLHPHVFERLSERKLTERDVAVVLASPEQRIRQNGRCIYQSRVSVGEKSYLLRVAVDVNERPPLVLTVYLTSQVRRYWRNDS